MGKTVIISDLHLGRPYGSAGSARALRPLWHDADWLIVNGDAAELHHPHYRTRAEQELEILVELCEKDNTAVTLICGNHDPFLSEYRHLSLHDGEVFITHGDVLHPDIAPWSVDAKTIRCAYQEAMDALEPADRCQLESKLQVSQLAAYSQWMPEQFRHRHGGMLEMLIRPWCFAHILWYWWRIPALGERFMQEHAPHARFLIFGHTHRQGVWQKGTHTLINTGSFGKPAHPRAVVIQAGQLAVYRILPQNEAYYLASTPLAQYTLNHPTHVQAPRMNVYLEES